ncbi:MAG: hypothetical protein M1824_003305 [Vezdaea acicularis]|nr:MAG: hypothetical protein M1824_003305 [Vezdaea acicularis]
MADSGANSGLIASNPPTWMAISAFTAVAWFNVIELNLQIFLTFKRHRGLYFWSLLISSWGVVLHALGFILKFFNKAEIWFCVSLITVGWYAMVTGQSVVLYSRLHLVVRDHRILRGVLIMICVDAFCFHIPTTVLTFGSNRPQRDDLTTSFTNAFSYMERIQMTAFCTQEFIISGLYVWATLKLLKPIYHGRTRKVMTHLIWINVIIVILDIVLLVMEYKNYYEIQATLKAMVYSIKLKLEFAVLNQLMTLANAGVNEAQMRSHHTADEPHYRRSESIATHNTRSASVDPSGFNGNPAGDPQIGHSTVATRLAPKHPLWTPSLDRNCIVKTQHVEVSSTSKECEEATRSGTGLATSNVGPAGQDSLMGTTIVEPTNEHHSKHSRHERLIRSTRPSVEDFGTGEGSETGSETKLNPYPGPIPQLGRERTDRWEKSDSIEKNSL